MVLKKELFVAIYQQGKICMLVEIILIALNNSKTFLICFEKSVKKSSEGKIKIIIAIRLSPLV